MSKNPSTLRFPVNSFYDAHLHLHFDQLAPHRTAIFADWQKIGFARGVVNATNEEEWPAVAALAREHPCIVPSFGLHPWDCGSRSSGWLTGLRAALLAMPAAGVGEIGLDRWITDGVRPDDPRIAGIRVASMEEQAEVLVAQLGLAAELNRAPSLHCVQAFGALLDLLRHSPLPRRGFLLHGYGGPAEMIQSFADLGAYFSFNIELLQPRLSARKENFRSIPADRLLVETDAPTKPPPAPRNRYPLPNAMDGSEVNHPANIAVTYEALAELRGLPLFSLASLVESNFQALFGS